VIVTDLPEGDVRIAVLHRLPSAGADRAERLDLSRHSLREAGRCGRWGQRRVNWRR
jgi:hypothetical protein